MARHFNSDDVDGVKGRELRAAFGEDTELVDVTEDLIDAEDAEDEEPVHDPEAFDYLHCPDCRGAPMMQPIRGASEIKCPRCGHTLEANE